MKNFVHVREECTHTFGPETTQPTNKNWFELYETSLWKKMVIWKKIRKGKKKIIIYPTTIHLSYMVVIEISYVDQFSDGIGTTTEKTKIPKEWADLDFQTVENIRWFVT